MTNFSKKVQKNVVIKKNSVFLRSQKAGGNATLAGETKSCCSSVVEHFLGKEGVASSTLANSSLFLCIAEKDNY